MVVNKLHDLKGENKKQRLIVVDENGKKITTATREECHHGEGLPHLAFVAFLRRRNGKFILTKRSYKKSLWGNYWDGSVVSHVLPGETVEHAASRRAREELGVEVEFQDLGAFYYHQKYGNDSENEYCHVLLGNYDGKVEINPIEISQIHEENCDNILKSIRKKDKLYTPWMIIAFEKIDFKKFLCMKNQKH
jgi:isopentenyl-diphosphate delta-isomerase